VFAVANATMLTGPSIQGNSVDCLSTRKPFAELSVQERIKEFDERLGEVLFVVLTGASIQGDYGYTRHLL
jgi:hypothetical protein